MASISNVEKGLFLKLFVRSGYVLDFTTSEFDTFTMGSVGVPLCEHYGMSKGKSLTAYINSAGAADCIKLLSDLFEYYEANYQTEISCNKEDYYLETSWHEAKTYQGIYLKCRQVMNRVNAIPLSISGSSESLKEKFSSEYMTAQIDLMVRMQSENPTEAIGKSKELIESCCKTILEECQSDYDSNWKVAQLVKATMKKLCIAAEDVDASTSEGKTVKAIMGNLQGVAGGLAELRNSYGSGHGKSASYKGLSTRHAKLAVGSSIALVEYLWDTFEWRKQAGRL